MKSQPYIYRAIEPNQIRVYCAVPIFSLFQIVSLTFIGSQGIVFPFMRYSNQESYDYYLFFLCLPEIIWSVTQTSPYPVNPKIKMPINPEIIKKPPFLSLLYVIRGKVGVNLFRGRLRKRKEHQKSADHFKILFPRQNRRNSASIH